MRYPRIDVNRSDCRINPPNCCQITCFRAFCPSACAVCVPIPRHRLAAWCA